MINQNHAILHYDMKRKCNCNGHSSHLFNMNMHIRLTYPIHKMRLCITLKCIFLLLENYSIWFSGRMLLVYSNIEYQRKNIRYKIGLSVIYMNIERFSCTNNGIDK